MTLNEISNTIRETATAYGFTTRDTDWHKIPEIVSDELNFTIHEDLNGDWENRAMTTTFRIVASVRKMGGEPTVEELLKTADEIRRGAELVKALEAFDFSYTEQF